MRFPWLRPAALVIACGLVVPASPATRVVTVRRDTPPMIDGDLSDECWQRARPFTGFVTRGGTIPAPVQTEGRILHDNEGLYIAIRCSEPDVSTMINGSRRCLTIHRLLPSMWSAATSGDAPMCPQALITWGTAGPPRLHFFAAGARRTCAHRCQPGPFGGVRYEPAVVCRRSIRPMRPWGAAQAGANMAEPVATACGRLRGCDS